MNTTWHRWQKVLRRSLMACALTVPVTACVNMSGLNGSPRYACQAPAGVACQSVSGTYANTAGQTGSQPGTAASLSLPAEPASAVPLAPASSAARLLDPQDNPSVDGLPLRAAPRILRLWIKPWEDDDGDLHDQRHVYLQIDDGRWQIDHLQRRIREAVAPSRPRAASVSPALQPSQAALAPATPGQRFPALPAGRPLPHGAVPPPAASNAAAMPPSSTR